MAISSLRRCRFEREITLFELQVATGIQASRLSLAERDLVRLRPHELARVANALAVDPELLTGDAAIAGVLATGGAR
ncbi:MAG: helix-turn-helix transcriptional regulator [Dehalococcoidia bacterium]